MKVNSAVFVPLNGLRKSSLILISSPGTLSRMVMVPSPTLLLPDQVKMAPVPAGAPSKTFFAAGSSFAHGDQAFQLWKSLIWAKIAAGGAVIFADLTTAKSA